MKIEQMKFTLELHDLESHNHFLKDKLFDTYWEALKVAINYNCKYSITGKVVTL